MPEGTTIAWSHAPFEMGECGLCHSNDDPADPGAINHFQALSAALSATVGLGNIGGVALAIALGGPGAVFWMWVVGFFGMALKLTEVTLSMLYRNTDDPDNPHGGPMWVASKGLARLNPKLAGVGKLIGGMTYGASEKESLRHFRESLKITPRAPIARIVNHDCIFDAFRDHLELQGTTHRDDRLGNGHVVAVVWNFPDEGLIDLQGVDRQLLQVTEGRVTGAKIIDSDLDT